MNNRYQIQQRLFDFSAYQFLVGQQAAVHVAEVRRVGRNELAGSHDSEENYRSYVCCQPEFHVGPFLSISVVTEAEWLNDKPVRISKN